MRTIQQGCFSELRTGSCNERADMVTKLSYRCSNGSPNLTKHHKNRVYFNKRVNNFLATDHAKLSWSSLTECRKYFIPVLCNQHGTEYNLDDSSPLTNGYPSGSSQKDKLKLVGVLTDGLYYTSARNELTKLALPAIVGQALDPVAQLLETAFIGRLGPVELAAAGVSVSIFNIISKLFNVPLLSVTTSFVAEEISKDADKASQKGYLANKKTSQNIVEKLVLPSVSTALLLASIIGAVEALALFMGAGAFLNMMGISPISTMRRPAQQFLSLRALGAPAVVVSLAIQGVFRGFKDTKTPLVCVACSSSISNSTIDRNLRIPNHSYALTAKNCVQCSCSSTTWQLDCHPTQGISKNSCPVAKCGSLALGNKSVSACETSICSYAGYTATSILTLLTNQSTCNGTDGLGPAPGSSQKNGSALRLGGEWMAGTQVMILHVALFLFGLMWNESS